MNNKRYYQSIDTELPLNGQKSFNPKNTLFGDVELHQKQISCFCEAKIIMFLWSSFLYERKVVGEDFFLKESFFFKLFFLS